MLDLIDCKVSHKEQGLSLLWVERILYGTTSVDEFTVLLTNLLYICSHTVWHTENFESLVIDGDRVNRFPKYNFLWVHLSSRICSVTEFEWVALQFLGFFLVFGFQIEQSLSPVDKT